MMPLVKTCKNSAAKNMPNFMPEYSILKAGHQFGFRFDQIEGGAPGLGLR